MSGARHCVRARRVNVLAAEVLQRTLRGIALKVARAQRLIEDEQGRQQRRRDHYHGDDKDHQLGGKGTPQELH